MSSQYFKGRQHPNFTGGGKAYKQERNFNKFTQEQEQQTDYKPEGNTAVKVVCLFVGVALIFAAAAYIARVM